MIRMRRCICSCLFVCLWITTGGQATVAQGTRLLEERIERLEQKVDRLTILIEQLVAERTRSDLLEQLLAERAGSGMTDLQTENEDRRAIAQAKANLATIRNGLGMYRAESDDSAFPGNSAITSYNDLREILSRYLRLPGGEEAGFTFESFFSNNRDEFQLRARALDRGRTSILVTPTSIQALLEPPPRQPARPPVSPPDRERPVSPQGDMFKIERAMAELVSVRTLFSMFRAESADSAYPETVTIQSYQSLAEVLSVYGRMPPAEVSSWTFMSYARPVPDRFHLTARARDTSRTVITVTPTGITTSRPPPLKEQ